MNAALRQRGLFAVLYDAASRGNPRVDKAACRDVAAGIAHVEAEIARVVADPECEFDPIAFSRTCGSIVRAMGALDISNDDLPSHSNFDGDALLDRAGVSGMSVYCKLIGRTLDAGQDDDAPAPTLDNDSPFGPKDDPELDAFMDADVSEAADQLAATQGPRRRSPPKRRALPDDVADDDVEAEPVKTEPVKKGRKTLTLKGRDP